MSIFNCAVVDLTTQDIAALAGAVESTVLECKAELDPKDPQLAYLKAVSALANTYGGYLVLGAATKRGEREIVSFPGIPRQPGTLQRLTDWAAQCAFPPIAVEISPPIAAPDDATRDCFVIHVPMSPEAPHFLDRRRGCFVRVADNSIPEDKLATWAELEALANRRAATAARRAELLVRSARRYDEHLGHRKMRGTRERLETESPSLRVAIAPLHPATYVASLAQLHQLADTVRIEPLVPQPFPGLNTRRRASQDSVLLLDPLPRPSMLDLSVWGHLFLGAQIGMGVGRDNEAWLGTDGMSALRYLRIMLSYAAEIYRVLPYDGPLAVWVEIRGINDTRLVTWTGNYPDPGPEIGREKAVHFDRVITTASLRNRPLALLRPLMQDVFHALGSSGEATNPANLDRALRWAYEQVGWSEELFEADLAAAQ